MLRKILIGLLSVGIIILAYIILSPNDDSLNSDFEKEILTSKLTLNKEETTEIFRTIIENRNIQPDSLINTRLISFLLYETENVEDSFENPPPPPSLKGWYTNADNLIRFFNSDEFLRENDSLTRKFFSQENDMEFLKNQIDLSKKVSEKISLTDLISDFNSKRNQKDGYHFYTPLFNKKRNQVYIQYDYYDGVYGDGFGVILIKENNTWKIVRIADIWIS